MTRANPSAASSTLRMAALLPVAERAVEKDTGRALRLVGEIAKMAELVNLSAWRNRVLPPVITELVATSELLQNHRCTPMSRRLSGDRGRHTAVTKEPRISP